jgi:hypothetical protein
MSRAERNGLVVLLGLQMDGWAPFGDVKNGLDWDADDAGGGGEGEGAASGYTTLYYQITEEQQSEECDMHQVVALVAEGGGDGRLARVR